MLFIAFLIGLVSNLCFANVGKHSGSDSEKETLYGILGLLCLVATIIFAACWGVMSV